MLFEKLGSKECGPSYEDDFHNMSSLDQEMQNFEAELFSPARLRKHIDIALLQIEKYLSDTSLRGLKLTPPQKLIDDVKSLMSMADNSSQHSEYEVNEQLLDKMIELYIQTGIQVHSTGYMGRQFSGVMPLAGVIDFISSIINQPSSFYEAAQLPNVVEHLMAEELNQFIGWQADTYAMVTTSGGSLANLTAILAARNDKYPLFWKQGINGLEGKRPAILVGADAHYSMARAAGIIGIGDEHIIRLPNNAQQQIDTNQIPTILSQAKQDGLDVFCLVASAGTTSVGAFDQLNEIADITEQHNIWLHVDAAHGGSLLVSDHLRQKLAGIDRVDSFTWDLHKTMFVPAMCTLLFYKNKVKSYSAFQQDASYVFEKKQDIYTAFDSAEQNFECTKRPLIMNFWMLWTLYGRRVFSKKLEYLCELTQQAFQLIQLQDDFTTLHKPECNILCFRYTPSNQDQCAFDDFQVAIRNQLKVDGKFFISKVEIHQESALRVVFMNHKIRISHVNLLLEEIRRIGQMLITTE